MKIIILLKLLILNFLSTNQNQLIKLSQESEIFMIIKGKGNQKILNVMDSTMERYIYIYISDIIINGQEREKIESLEYYLEEEKNEIILKYGEPISSASYMFYKLSNITKIDLSRFDSSKIKSMFYTFYECNSLTSINFTNFRTPLLNIMGNMFYNCYELETLDLEFFDTSLVTYMNENFYGCTSLKSLNLKSFNTSKVAYMEKIFYNCISLTSIDIYNFDTKNVKYMTSMFYGCQSLKSLNLSNFNTIKVEEMNQMFYNCQSLTSLILDSFNTSIVTNMNQMFGNCKLLTSLNLSNFNTSSVLKMDKMFSECNSLSELNFNFSIPLVKSLYGFFSGCHSLKSIDMSNFKDINSLTNIENIFSNCILLTSLFLDNFDTSKVINMANMFNSCISLSSLSLNFDTSKVTNMSYMFFNCSSLTELNISRFNTRNVEDMEGIFAHCISFTSLDLDHFNALSLRITKDMFKDCIKLKILEINNFDPMWVSEMEGMFSNCKSLISLDLSNFEVSRFEKYPNMFEEMNPNLIYCINIKSIENVIESLSNYTFNCSYFCSKKGKKMIYDTNACIDDCSLSQRNIYEFANICYRECSGDLYYNYTQTGCIDFIPEGYYLKSKYARTIDKCIDKCNNCTLESISNDLCITCNTKIGYYQKKNELIENSFINCYNEIPEEYYFDEIEQMYKHCHTDCKCLDLDNLNNHKCSNCNQTLIRIKGNCYKKCDHYYYFNNSNEYQCTSTEICPDEFSKIIMEKKECTNNCVNDDIYKYELNNSCYDSCPNGTHISLENEYLCEIDLICEKYYNYNLTGCIDYIPEGYYLDNIQKKTIEKCDIKCKNCTKESMLNNLCISCNHMENYHEKYNDSSNNNSFINCYNNPEAYYFDSINKIYKSCYSTCKSCNELGNITNNKCTECYIDYIKIEENCYKKCNYYYFFDSSNEYHCTEDKICPDTYNKLIEDKNQCIDDCNKDNSYKFLYKNKCYENCPSSTKITNNNTCEEILCSNEFPYIIIETGECSKNCSAVNFFNHICKINSDDQKIKDEIINTIRVDLLKGDINNLLIPKVLELNEDLIVRDNNMIYQLTSSFIQNNTNEKINMTIIKLGECEDLLRNKYNLNKDDVLIIFKLEIYNIYFLIPIIEYEIYSLKIKEQLDLSICNNTKIHMFHFVNIDENNIFKYNSTDDFYTDKCTPYTTENNVDVTLEDRKNEYIEKNMSLCEVNCEYIGYNFNTKKAECECKPKESIIILSGFKFDKDLLLNNFKDIKKTINLFLLKCFFILFSIDGFIKNIGSYILLFIISIEILCLIIFIYKGYSLLLSRIKYFIGFINNIKNGKIAKKNNIVKNDFKANDNEINQSINKANIFSLNNNNSSKKKKNKKKREINKKKKIKINNQNFNNSSKNIFRRNLKLLSPKLEKINKIKIVGKMNTKDRGSSIIINNQLEVSKFNNINNNNKYNYNDYELNNLNYEDALLFDKRSYFQYYISLIKQKQLLIFTFYTYSDYNSKIIKISLFLFFFASCLTINALIFSDSSMHKIYADKGKYNFIYEIPKILYSTIISIFINTIIRYLSLTEKNVLQLREEKDSPIEIMNNISKCLKIKFYLLFILEFLLLIFFWYYISCFCAVYRNTQFHLLRDFLSSFGLSLIYPFVICVIPGTIRIPSLRDKSKGLGCAYKFSKVLQLL